MRWQIKVCILVFVGFVGLEFAFGQFGTLGSIFKDGRTDPVALLQRIEVKNELKLNPQQLEKVDEAIWEALSKVLDPEQYKRLEQIDLQQRDYRVFGDPKYQRKLQMDAQQVTDMNTIIADTEKDVESKIKDINAGIGGPAAAQSRYDEILALRREGKDKCVGLLENNQKRIWVELVGDAFQLDGPKIDIADLLKKAKKGDPGTKKAKKG